MMRRLFRELRSQFTEVLVLLQPALDPILDRIFSYRRRAAQARWVVLTFLLACGWVLLGFIGRDPSLPAGISMDKAGKQVSYVVQTVFSTLFSEIPKPKELTSDELTPLIFEMPFDILLGGSDAFRHILLAGFALWLAFKLAAIYQSDLYNIKDTRVAEHYLLQTALINPYNSLNIQDGDVPLKHQELPIFRIGGPGRVRVFLENAALFEGPDGTPRVIGPTQDGQRRTNLLEGFEKLRTVIDLRDQKETFSIPGRSQDGIPVSAEDVQIVYSVFRGEREGTLQEPYPFVPKAIETLVYNQGRGTWIAAASSQIQGELRDFFARHPLSEFLAMIETPEQEKMTDQEEQLRKEGDQLAGVDLPKSPSTPKKVESNPYQVYFVPRPEITDLFYSDWKKKGRSKGIELKWVGVGTWDLPSEHILRQHQEAWRITHENKERSRPGVLTALRKEHRLKEIIRLIQTVPMGPYPAFQTKKQLSLEDTSSLIVSYTNKMYEAFRDAFPYAEDELKEKLRKNAQEIDRNRRELRALGRDDEKKAEELRAKDENLQAEKRELDGKYQTLREERKKLRKVLMFLARVAYRWASGDHS